MTRRARLLELKQQLCTFSAGIMMTLKFFKLRLSKLNLCLDPFTYIEMSNLKKNLKRSLDFFYKV